LSFFLSHSLLPHKHSQDQKLQRKINKAKKFFSSHFEDGSFDPKEKGRKRRRSYPAEEASQKGQGCCRFSR
jgi:hypothetical protein